MNHKCGDHARKLIGPEPRKLDLLVACLLFAYNMYADQQSLDQLNSRLDKILENQEQVIEVPDNLSKDIKYLRTVKHRVLLRQQIENQGKAVQILEQGDIVQLLEDAGDWVRIRSFGLNGKDFVEGWLEKEDVLD